MTIVAIDIGSKPIEFGLGIVGHEPPRFDAFALAVVPVIAARFERCTLLERDVLGADDPELATGAGARLEGRDLAKERKEARRTNANRASTAAVRGSRALSYALSAYTAGRTAREMAIRRVVGAGGVTIALLHLQRGAAPALLGALLAGPAAYLIAERWLDGFDTRIQFISFYILLACGGALAVALSASLVEAISMTRRKPTDCLRSGQ